MDGGWATSKKQEVLLVSITDYSIVALIGDQKNSLLHPLFDLMYWNSAALFLPFRQGEIILVSLELPHVHYRLFFFVCVIRVEPATSGLALR